MTEKTQQPNDRARAEPRQKPPYAAPRILSKRPVERVTLVSGEGCVGPDCGIGGE